MWDGFSTRPLTVPVKSTAAHGLPIDAARIPPNVVPMRTRLLVLLAFFALPLSAQTTHRNDFDYLLGDWEFTAVSKQWGKFTGLWSAVRLDTGQILDEYRVLGDKGETMYVTSTLRNYNKALDRWELVGLDEGNGLHDVGTARRTGDEVHLEQTYGTSTSRIRYYNIGPDHFSWTSDHSIDGGKTWMKNFQTIEAHRIGPARSLGALTPAKK
jgi:hypothetical protein